MRWRFQEDHDEQERNQREVTRSAIDRLWSEFAARMPEIEALMTRSGPEWDLAGWMQSLLSPIDTKLMFEFGAGGPSGRRLVITPERERQLLPLVREVIARAPQIDGWEWLDHRPPETVEYVVSSTRAWTGVSVEGATFHLAPGAHHRVDVTVYGLSSPSDAAQRAAVEGLLGEHVFHDWIGDLTAGRPTIWSRLGGRKASAITMSQLPAAVDAEIARILSALPAVPGWAVTDEMLAETKRIGAVFKRQVPQLDDYPRWSDCLVASASDPALWQATHVARGFASQRFSRHGEVFAYLKIDGREGLEVFEDRAAIEDAIDAPLCEERAGSVCGGGTGVVYSYIDLALTDVPRAIDILRRVLRAGRIPQRTWLLFHDDTLRDEWLGIGSDAPAPP